MRFGRRGSSDSAWMVLPYLEVWNRKAVSLMGKVMSSSREYIDFEVFWGHPSRKVWCIVKSGAQEVMGQTWV